MFRGNIIVCSQRRPSDLKKPCHSSHHGQERHIVSVYLPLWVKSRVVQQTNRLAQLSRRRAQSDANVFSLTGDGGWYTAYHACFAKNVLLNV